MNDLEVELEDTKATLQSVIRVDVNDLERYSKCDKG